MKNTHIYGMSDADYDKIDAIRCSDLKLFDGATPRHVRYRLEHPDPETEAKEVGSALHLAVLEPDRFPNEVCTMDLGFKDYRSKAARLARDAFLAENAHKIVLKPDTFHVVKRMSEAAWAHPTLRRMLQGPGHNEVVLTWDEDGVACKCKIDRVTEHNGYVTMIDLKSIGNGNAGPRDAGRAARVFGYDLQHAFYTRGMNAVFGESPRLFVLAMIEKDPPHLVSLYTLDNDAIADAERAVNAHLKTLVRCRATGEWPGWRSDISILSLPWRRYTEDDDG